MTEKKGTTENQQGQKEERKLQPQVRDKGIAGKMNKRVLNLKRDYHLFGGKKICHICLCVYFKRYEKAFLRVIEEMSLHPSKLYTKLIRCYTCQRYMLLQRVPKNEKEPQKLKREIEKEIERIAVKNRNEKFENAMELIERGLDEPQAKKRKLENNMLQDAEVVEEIFKLMESPVGLEELEKLIIENINNDIQNNENTIDEGIEIENLFKEIEEF